VDIVETRLVDSQKVIKRLGGSCDKLLLDVPCSNTGVLAKRPEVRYRLNKKQINEIEKTIQERLDAETPNF
jgi:16S rRNA (cytosine967-C5)-methyltransferase